jgi:hypothetical protein
VAVAESFYTLKRINAITGGLRGEAALAAISRRFERPANPNKEIKGATDGTK